jgi:DNA polymerase-3 subunit gamma/tau
MLTKEAFNALLKTLEEPPAHAIFILATTEKEKVPETIISRCQSFTFALPSLTILTELVQQVAAAEKYTIDEYTAGLVARSGDGSFRDTLGALEKVMTASTDKNLSREEVEAILGVPPHELIQKFITALAEKKLPEAMGVLGALTDTATALPTVLELALTTTRDALLLKHTNTSSLDEAYLKTLIALPHFGLPLHQMLLDAAMALRRSPLPKQALEAAVIGWCVAGK